MDTVKKITSTFCEKAGTSSPGSIYSGLYAIEKLFQECNDALAEAGMPDCCYSFQSEAISQMTQNMQILKTYVQYAHTYVWQTLDHPLWADFNAHATQSLSEIVLDDITADNTFQMEEHIEVTRQGYGGPHKKVKSELKFSDFLGLVEITPEDGYPVLENVECVGEFASLFRADYDRMKPEGTDINTFLEGYLVSGEYDHTVYDPVKDFISGLLDITIIKPIIECFTGEDLITGATLSDLERALKLGGAIVDLFTLGQAMVLTKGAGLGAKAIGKTVILELASNAAVYSVGYGCDALGMPVVASWGLSILTGCTVSAVGGKYLFKDSSGNVIKECTSLEAEQILKKGAELDGNIKSYADWMLPKDAEVFLQYKATGSLDGLSEADINSIRKLEELIELKQVEYQDIFNVRNKDEVLARNSKVHRVEDVVGDGLDANLLDDMGKFTDDALENNYQAYVNRKISKGQTPKDRLEWKKASDYWTKESPVARGNNFNKTVREADIYDYHEVYLENGKRLDSYDPDAGEIISRKATD